MYTKTLEPFKTTIKPFNNLIEINTKFAVQLINLQKTLLTSISWELAAQTKSLSTQTDLTEVLNDQKYYTDQMQTKVSTSAKDAYEMVTKNSEDVASFVEGSISDSR